MSRAIKTLRDNRRLWVPTLVMPLDVGGKARGYFDGFFLTYQFPFIYIYRFAGCEKAMKDSHNENENVV